MTEDRVLMG